MSPEPKAALRAKRLRGEILGNTRNLPTAQALGREAQRLKADKQAARIVPIIVELRALGLTSLTSIADALNKRGIGTARGRAWHAGTVRNILTRQPALNTV